MIESCTKKRMLTAVTCLGGLTLLVLIVESHWASESGGNFHGASYKNVSQGDACWLTEGYEVVQDCSPCTAFEVASKSVPACIVTGYKETLLCKTSGKVLRGCDRVTWIEERRFWTFEGSMLVAAIFSWGTVYFRQRILDHRMLVRIQRQLASGV